MKTLKSIYHYDNYREFLSDFYASAKSRNPNFSFRVFSRQAGFKGGNVLKRVMDGDHNIAAESIEKFVLALKLNKEEAVFFRNLVFLNQAKSHSEKQVYAEQILRLRSYKKEFPLKLIQYRLFAKWYLSVIREMVTLPEFQEDYAWIASKIYPKISPYDAKEAIRELLQIGLLERNEQGRLAQGNPAVSTQDEIVSSALSMFHKEMMSRAAESIERVPREERDLMTLTFGCSLPVVKKLKEILLSFRKEAIEAVTNDTSPHDNVYQLSFYFFPLLEMKKKEKNP